MWKKAMKVEPSDVFKLSLLNRPKRTGNVYLQLPPSYNIRRHGTVLLGLTIVWVLEWHIPGKEIIIHCYNTYTHDRIYTSLTWPPLYSDHVYHYCGKCSRLVITYLYNHRLDGDTKAQDLPADVPLINWKKWWSGATSQKFQLTATMPELTSRNHSCDDDKVVVWRTERSRRITYHPFVPLLKIHHTCRLNSESIVVMSATR